MRKYIDYLGKDILDVLRENKLIDPDFYDTMTIACIGDDKIGSMFIWRMGQLMTDITEISMREEVPILFEPYQKFIELFNALGRWLFSDYNLSKISNVLEDIKITLNYAQNEIYNDVIKEIRILNRDISSFLNERLQSENSGKKYPEVENE